MSRDLHVLTLIDGLGWGGAEMLLAELAAGAAAADLRLSVGYLYEKDGSPAAARLRALGVEPVHIGAAGLLAPRSYRGVRDHVRATRPDVVHTHLGYSDLLGGLAARRLGVPSVSTIHLAHWERPDGRRDDLKLWLFAQARRRCGDRVITVSEAARTSYLSQGWDVPERVITVHNGVRDTARERVPVLRAELGLGEEDLVVTMVSVLRPGKGHEAAFDAVRRLAGQVAGRQLRLLVLGDGPLRAELRAAARDVPGHVVMAGHRNDVPAVLAASDVLLHPSDADAFPTALLEAMAAAVPVVATAVGGIPEIVVPGVTGVLVAPPADGESLARALEPILQDRGYRQALGAAARTRFVERFTAEAWALRLRAVYDRLERG